MGWQKVGDHGYVVELAATYIGARLPSEDGVPVLTMYRVFWCEECGHFEHVQPGLNLHQRDHSGVLVDYIAPDTLGAPSEHLRPIAG